MDRDDVLKQLREHEPELRSLGVLRLSLFGSMARDEARADSDVDLLAVFDEARHLSLLDLLSIERRIAGWVGRPVDLLEEGQLKQRVAAAVEAELVRAF